MKKIIMVALIGLSMSAQAQQVCARLEYKEMRDMSTDELSVEYCRSYVNVADNVKGMVNAFVDNDTASHIAFKAAGDDCHNQKLRIGRILEQRAATIPEKCM